MGRFSALLCSLILLINNCVYCHINEPTSENKKPHIILIVADDLGFNDVPWHNKEVVAPNIQALAEEGIILEQSYVQPICSPTRSALLTGKYPFTIGRQGSVIWPLMPTGLTLDSFIIPQLLKPLGYSTHAIGKWHLGFCKWAYTPTERGFDTFRGYYTGSEGYFSHIRGEKAYDFRNNKEIFNITGVYSTYEFASHAEDILRASPSSIPKFIYMAFQSVHGPLQVPDNYTIPYAHIKDKNRRTLLGMVTAMDEAIGRIVKVLKETKHFEDSIIIFTSDNGGATVNGGNNWPLRGNKTTLWEGGTRGAAFVHSPRITNPGSISNNLIHVADWMATIVNLAGGLPPKNTDSIDQWPALVSESTAPRNEFVYDIVDHKQNGLTAAIRQGDYKLLIGDPGPGEWTQPPKISPRRSERKAFSEMTFQDHYSLIVRMKKWCHDSRCLQKLLRSYEYQLNLNKNMISSNTTNAVWKVLRTEFNKKRIQRYVQQLLIATTDYSGNTSTIDLNSLEVRLYNLKYDPEERVNLYLKRQDIVLRLAKKIFSYKKRYVDQDIPDDEPRGLPEYWGDVWSPGWC